MLFSPMIEFLGRLPIKVRRGIAHGAWWSLYPHSAYWRQGGNDAGVEAMLRQHAIRPANVVWDLGAHYGIYSVGIARHIGPNGRVESFEPDPVSFRRLQWHRRLNRLSNLHIHQVAASDQTGQARLYQYDDFGATTSHLPYPDEGVADVPFREIRTVALDDWVEAGRIKPPGFIKIDVEGHAGQALRGMLRTLISYRPILLLAVHDKNEHDSSLSILTSHDYECRPVTFGVTPSFQDSFFGELICLPSTGIKSPLPS